MKTPDSILAVIVGTAIQISFCFSSPLACADVVYGMTFDGELYSVSTTDAHAELIGQATIGGVLSGLEYDSSTGQLLALTAGNAGASTSLYRVDPVTAVTTEIGPTNWPVIYEGALQFAPTGELYALNGADSDTDLTESLLQIDVQTGEATRVVRLINDDLQINGLAWTPSGLVGIDDRSDSLLSIDLQTGATTLFAETPINPGFYGGMANGSEGTGYYTAFDGTLHAFNLVDGSSSLIGDTGQFFGGLAVVPAAIPEPSSGLASALIVCSYLF
ncbi:MAG: hypothetical protein AAGA03_20640, partial [Planctomycetota bacterium]